MMVCLTRDKTMCALSAEGKLGYQGFQHIHLEWTKLLCLYTATLDLK